MQFGELSNNDITGNCKETNKVNCIYRLNHKIPNLKKNRFNVCSHQSFHYLSGVCWITSVLDLISRTSLLQYVKSEIQEWVIDAQTANKNIRGAETSLAIYLMPESIRDYLYSQNTKYFRKVKGNLYFVGDGGVASSLLYHILTISSTDTRVLPKKVFNNRANDLKQLIRTDVDFKEKFLIIDFSTPKKTLAQIATWLHANHTYKKTKVLGGLIMFSDHVMCFTICIKKMSVDIRLCHDGEAIKIEDLQPEWSKTVQSLQILVQLK